jgi:hypothetical protein
MVVPLPKFAKRVEQYEWLHRINVIGQSQMPNNDLGSDLAAPSLRPILHRCDPHFFNILPTSPLFFSLGEIHVLFLVVNQDRAMRSAYYLGCLIQIEQPN